jgi:uncharacterized protein (TIGR03435 family)
MEAVVSVPSQEVGRTVLDETRLNGKYDFTLERDPDDVRPVAGKIMASQDSAEYPIASEPRCSCKLPLV